MAQQTRTEQNEPRQRTSEQRPGAGAAGQDSSEVEQLLERFARAFTAGDGRTVASLWETPALVVGDQQVIAVGTRAEVEQFFGGANQQYNQQGIVDTRPEIMRLEWATERLAVVKVRWPYLDASGREHGEERSTYTLRRDDAGALKVRAVIMHGVTQPH